MTVFGPGELQMAVLRTAKGMDPASTLLLAQTLDVPAKRISKAASSLVARHYLRRRHPGVYEITPHGEAALHSGMIIKSGPIDADQTVLSRAPAQGFRDRIWTSMRMRRSFTIHDLVCDAINGEADAVNDAGRYIRILKSAGYVTQLLGKVPGTRPGSNGFKRFRLVKNTGPRAPLHRSKLGLVHDFNTGEDVLCSPC